MHAQEMHMTDLSHGTVQVVGTYSAVECVSTDPRLALVQVTNTF